MSSGSESDEEFVPGEPEKLSEEDSADDETEKQYEKEQELKAKKRKIAAQSTKPNKRRSIRGTRGTVAEEPEEVEEAKEPEDVLSPEEQKKKDDELWAMFLQGTDSKYVNKSISNNVTKVETKKSEIESKPQAKSAEAIKKENEERERRIFEFAGETVVVENDVIKETIPKKLDTTNSSSGSTAQEAPKPRKSGMMGVLNKISRKDSLSTLEKSALDWNTYKKKEGVEEEVKSHNKGKQGYLDRQDFLQRADLRQFEIERDLRLSKRTSNR